MASALQHVHPPEVQDLGVSTHQGYSPVPIIQLCRNTFRATNLVSYPWDDVLPAYFFARFPSAYLFHRIEGSEHEELCLCHRTYVRFRMRLTLEENQKGFVAVSTHRHVISELQRFERDCSCFCYDHVEL